MICVVCGNGYRPRARRRMFRTCGRSCSCVLRERNKPRPSAESIAGRFWAYVDRKGPDACWPWKMGCNRAGYGRMNVGGAAGVVLAHRLALEYSGTPIPAGLLGLHHCDNPPCCNPAHLYVGTPLDNARDAQRRHRTVHLHGELGGNAKLRNADIPAILLRLDRGDRQAAIAADYGVDNSQISRINTGKRWRVPGARSAHDHTAADWKRWVE